MWYTVDFSAPVEVTRIGRIHYTSNWNLRGKRATVDKMVFVVEGSVEYMVDGKRYEVSRGGFLYIPKGSFYASKIDKSCDFYYLHFEASKVNGPFSEEEGKQMILNVKKRAESVSPMPTGYYAKSASYDVFIKDYLDVSRYFEPIILLISKCESNKYVQYPSNKLYINNRFEHLLLHLSREAMSEVIPINEVPPLLLKITSYIQQNYTNQITLSSISQEFGLSKQYIIRLFKTYHGTTVTKYINTMRLERSLELLKHASMNVNEIAAFLGYNSTYYFCRLFKATYFITPTEYIKSDINVDYEA